MGTTVALRRACVTSLLALSVHWAVEAQWTNRYPKVAGFGHHVYLEGYELPTLGSGPTDPSASPDGASLAFSARGWLWLLDLQTGEARRLTRGGGMDSRPAWSPNGQRIAFVRDDGRDTRLLQIEVATGAVTEIVDTPAIDLDPAYSHDGGTVFYTSAEAGDLDLWQVELATGAKRRLTSDEGLELRPLPLPGGHEVVFVAKGQGLDRLTVLDSVNRPASRARGAPDRIADEAGAPSGRAQRGGWHAESRRMGSVAGRCGRGTADPRRQGRHASDARLERRWRYRVLRGGGCRPSVPPPKGGACGWRSLGGAGPFLDMGRGHCASPDSDTEQRSASAASGTAAHRGSGRASGDPRLGPGLVRRTERACLLLLSRHDDPGTARRRGEGYGRGRVRDSSGVGRRTGCARGNRFNRRAICAALGLAGGGVVFR